MALRHSLRVVLILASSAAAATAAADGVESGAVCTSPEASEAEETCALQVHAATVGKSSQVSCGGHYASSCAYCPQGNGASWCNGDCVWQSGNCVPKGGGACCAAVTSECLACSADVTEAQYCQAHPETVGCPRQCCRAATADCLACAADVTEEQYCAQHPGTAGCPSSLPGQVCALCDSCGGSYPINAGRTTYFRDESTEWVAYGEWCSSQLRTRSGDGSVIFSPHICCSAASAGLLEAGAEEVAESETQEAAGAKEVAESNEQGAAGSGAGWCRICDTCGGAYGSRAGRLSWMPSGTHGNNAQNFERYVGACSESYGSDSAPPAGEVCCKAQQSRPVCAVCGGSCGGMYSQDGGYLSYAKGETVEFMGFGSQCGGNFQSWQANSLGFYPKLCCMSR